MNLSTAFHPQTNRQVERTIQTLKDMLRDFVIDFKRNWVDHLPLMRLFMIGSVGLPLGGLRLVRLDCLVLTFFTNPHREVKIIRDRLQTSQSCQKSYADVRQKELEFDVGD